MKHTTYISIVALVWTIVNYLVITGAILLARHMELEGAEYPTLGFATIIFIVGSAISCYYLIKPKIN